ncbi:MAG TPA: C10 family peptidase [Bacteroidales bacterium]|nr:C10 family peptidase [Bacteroidales bacterium]
MKSLKLLFTFFALAVFVFSSYAEKIEKNEAKKVAANFIFETAASYYSPVAYQTISFTDVHTEYSNGEEVYYIFNQSGDGFVIVSAESDAEPILGYSMEGTYDPTAEHAVFESWMQGYVDAINYVRNNPDKADESMEEKWEYYLTGNLSELNINQRGNRDISPLLTNTWNQDYPYNAYCPEDDNGPGGHAYAGCVATAMSMIMYHYKYPVQGSGQTSYYCYPYGTLAANFGETEYMWDAMTDDISSSSPEHSIHAIAELQYQCGVAVNMNYSPEGSGSYSYLVPAAIEQYFNYSTDAAFMSKNSYTLTEWKNHIMENLEDDHPIYYSGQSTEGGHAFCLDGNQGSSMFHFNFGWSGSMNGYYPLEGAGAVGGYNQDQGMVKNFYPPAEEYPYECTTDTLHYLGGTIDDGAMPYKSYATNANCKWLLMAPTVQDSVETFEIDFLEFNLESSDYVRIYDGPTEDDELLGEFSGTTLPSGIESTSNQVLIVFESDANETDHDGFRLEFEADLPAFCSGVSYHSEESGTFDDGSGDYNYNNNKVCQYILNPENASDLTIFFDEFDLGDGDRIVIYQTSPTLQLAELTNEDDPESFTAESGSMMITMQTDNMYNGNGFVISYQIGNVGVGTTDFMKEFTLFPNPAKDLLNVRFRANIEGQATMQINTLDGRTMLIDRIENRAGTFLKEVNVSDFEPGVYMVNIFTKEGMAAKKFIVK